MKNKSKEILITNKNPKRFHFTLSREFGIKLKELAIKRDVELWILVYDVLTDYIQKENKKEVKQNG